MSTNDYEAQIKAIEDNNVDKSDKTYGGVATLPIHLIFLENDNARLRDAQLEEEEYKQLRSNIQQYGLKSPIAIRKSTKTGQFIINDGVQRWTICKELGHEHIDVKYFPNLTDPTDIMVTQLTSNIQRVKTKKGDLARQLRRILMANPGMTQADLARITDTTQAYISQILSINVLSDELLQEVNTGSISMRNAMELAKLPEAEVDFFVERARTMDPDEFAIMVDNHKRKLKNEKLGNKEEVWQPRFSVKAAGDIKQKLAELAKLVPADVDFSSYENNKSDDIRQSYIVGMYHALQWTGNVDPVSVQDQLSRHEAMLAERERKKLEKQAAKEADGAVKEVLDDATKVAAKALGIKPIAVA